MQITPADVQSFLGLQQLSAEDQVWMDLAVQSVESYLAEIQPHRDWRNPPAHRRNAMILFAARLWERRGADASGDNADYTYGGDVALIGSQIAQHLNLGRYNLPLAL